MTVYVILSIVIVDMLSCFIYCSIRKSRQNKGSVDARTEMNKTNEVIYISKFNLIKIIKSIYQLYRKIMDSVLRINLFYVSYIPSHHIRNWLYKYVFKVTIKHNAVIYYGTEIRAPWNITIGEGSVIGDRVILDGRNGIQIGANVNISTGASIWTMQHEVNAPDFGIGGGTTVIEDRAWISCNTVILPGVKIHEGSVVAAGAVVTKDTQPYSINGGVPSKKIGDRSHDLTYIFDGSYVHFL